MISDDSASIAPISRNSTLGDRIRTIASQLRQEDDIQIKATSRILGAAAQLAENHDRLIDDVVEMVEDDLDQGAQPPQPESYTVEQLQQQFESLKDAKAHFNLKARSWAALADKLNERIAPSSTETSPTAVPDPSVSRPPKTKGRPDPIFHRLERIEQELQMMRGDVNRMIHVLELLVKRVP